MDIQKSANHKAVPLNKLVNFKTPCLAKSKLIQGLVFD